MGGATFDHARASRRGSRILVREASGVLPPRGAALSPKFAQNRGFPLKIARKLHDLKKILGARGDPGSATGPLQVMSAKLG